MPKVVIVGAGFAGINAAKALGRSGKVDVTVIDRRNHHLFQPLLYQVAMAGLSPADIAAPIRSMLNRYPKVRVIQAEVDRVDLPRNLVVADGAEIPYDYLMLACGAQHSYFGHDEWEEFAPGLKSLEQATEIRRRVLTAYEEAERITDRTEQKRLLTFVVVGGGPTGVELAGAIGEMSRFTLGRDFRNIDAEKARVILIEAGPRPLATFDEDQSSIAMRELEKLGVQTWTNSRVTKIDAQGVEIGHERIDAATVLWAAGVQASELGKHTGVEVDRQGRVPVEPDLTVKGHPNVFVAGDQSLFTHQTGAPLPGTAPVAIQQGRYIAKTILRDVAKQPREPFHFVDKGQMATIGRSKAVLEIGKLKLSGFLAWMTWLVVHIYYLTGFKNRLLVVLQWAWSYFSFHRGARLIVNKEWRSTAPQPTATAPPPTPNP
jgi:NADH dehydrogenase